MDKISIQYYKSPFGELVIGSLKEKLCLCDWRYRKMRNAIDTRICKALKAEFVEEKSQVIDKTKIQLEQYFAKEREEFDLPVILAGSEFQKKVWKKLMEIPYGETSSYLQLAKQLGNEKVIRAAATANGANAISIIVPCHRIIGADGSLVGYAGGIPTKKALLELEGSLHSSQLKLDF